MGIRQLIVQFKTDGDLVAGGPDRLFAIEEALFNHFESHPIAYEDGNDFGSGTMNIFIVLEPQTAWDSVIQETKACLKHLTVLDQALIATQSEDDQFAIVWPPNYEGEFSYF
jgi:hypothetical protein